MIDRTGIRTRYWAEKDEFTSDLAVRAGRIALANACMEASELTAILVGSITPDYPTPSVSSIVHGQLSANESCNALDFSAACAGSVKGLEIASALVNTNRSACVLVIGAEVLSKMISLGDKKTVPLFGDGAGAAIVQAQPDALRPHFVSLTQPEQTTPMSISSPGGGMREPDQKPVLIMSNGGAIVEAGGDLMYRSALLAAEKAGIYDSHSPEEGIDWAKVRWCTPHQANKRMLESLYVKLQVPENKRVYTVEKYGNTSGASVLMALATIAAEGGFEQNDQFLAPVVGAGYVGGAAIMTTKLN